jgi:hypothetical protein
MGVALPLEHENESISRIGQPAGWPFFTLGPAPGNTRGPRARNHDRRHDALLCLRFWLSNPAVPPLSMLW